MKILVFGNGARYGGIQTAYREFVMFLRDEGHTVGTIAIAPDETDDDGISPTDNIAMRRFIRPWRSGLRGKIKGFTESTLAKIAARSFAPEMFVAIGLSNGATMIARAISGSCFKLALDAVAHRPANHPHLVAAARFFDAIAVQSPSMIRMLTRQGFNSAPLTSLPCLPLPRIPNYERQPHPGHARIAYFGRLAANKGVDVFLEALSDIDAEQPFSVDIHGDGNQRDKLAALAKSVRAPITVAFKGAYPRGEERVQLMCGYDALVVPSQWKEGLPLVLLEAMSYGIPVLTTNVAAISDCCDGNPDFLMVNPDRAALKGGIEMLLQGLRAGSFDTKRLQQYYETHFSYAVMTQRWREFLASPRAFFE